MVDAMALLNAAKRLLLTAAEKYAESPQSTLTSKIKGLENMNLILEITSTNEDYLWTLIIFK